MSKQLVIVAVRYDLMNHMVIVGDGGGSKYFFCFASVETVGVSRRYWKYGAKDVKCPASLVVSTKYQLVVL